MNASLGLAGAALVLGAGALIAWRVGRRREARAAAASAAWRPATF